MVDLRVLTWNSGGEADGRGATLANDVIGTNNHWGGVPVQLVTIQEANVGGGSIAAALANGPPFNTFIQPQGFCREHLPAPAQPYRVMPSKAYRVSWLNTDPVAGNNIPTVPAVPALVNLDPANDAGVNAYIINLNLGPLPDASVRQAAGNMRWPVYQLLNRAGRAVHFFTWHAPLRANWLGADVLGIPLQGPGLSIAFTLFQNSTFYTNIMNNLALNDLVVIAGDLNITGPDLANPVFFPNYIGVSENLTHILAYSPNNNMVANQNLAAVTPFPPHTILTARIQW
ncbi:MAG: hypothetical protein KDC71_24025 [Acidobacteria bacterium]|nr:hypothetical protein [Acidobacteriota bacterium]